MFKLFLGALTLASFVMVFGLVGSMDYESAQAEADYYASMVCDGLWPDYENRNPNCEEVK